MLENLKIVSGKLLTVGNRLFTAIMLVALLIACQEMPEANNFNPMETLNLDADSNR